MEGVTLDCRPFLRRGCLSRDRNEVREQARHISRAGTFPAERRQVKSPKKGDFPGGPMVKIQASNAGVRV